MNEAAAQSDEARRRGGRDDLPASAIFGELWRSKLVKLALTLVLVGGGLWIYGAMTRAPRPAPAVATGTDSYLVTGLQGQAAAPGGAVTSQGAEANGLAETMGPKMAGGGASFVGAYGLGWLFRRFLKLAAILTGLGIAGVTGLAGLGVIGEDDTAKVRDKLSEGGDWVYENLGAFKDRAMEVLPGGVTGSAAGLGGLFFGFRKK